MAAFLKNWLTTLFGGVPGLGLIIMGAMANPIDWTKIMEGVGLLLTGAAAKDFNVTGRDSGATQ